MAVQLRLGEDEVAVYGYLKASTTAPFQGNGVDFFSEFGDDLFRHTGGARTIVSLLTVVNFNVHY